MFGVIILLVLSILLTLLATLVAGLAVGQWQGIQSRALWYRQQQTHSARLLEQQRREVMRQVTEKPAWTGWRRLVVAEVVQESADCRSYYLQTPDAQPMPPFRPGQFIMVGVNDPQQPTAILSRCYSLSDAPDPRYWRITVRRQPGGRMSNHLHDRIGAGDVLLARAPAGRLTVDQPHDDQQPLTLIAAGVGITPLVSILRHSLIWRPERPLRLFYQVRDRDHAPFLDQLRRWAAQRSTFELHCAASRPEEAAPHWADSVGRLGGTEILARLAAAASAEPSASAEPTASAALDCSTAHLEGLFLICGPDPFTADLRRALLSAGVPPAAIRSESFGAAGAPAGVAAAGFEAPGEAMADPGEPPVAGEAVEICFARSGRTGQWSRPSQTLLEAAEASGVAMESGCREGQCGSCLVRVLSGRFEHTTSPGCGPLEADEALACVARPIERLTLDV